VVIVPAEPRPAPINEEKAREVIFQPNPGPQTAFLAADEQEVLYGGAGGGGKSFAMLADPVRYLTNEYAKMLLVRKTTEELRELISVSKTLYPKAIPGIKFLEREKTWVAPSGATLWMSYLDADDDVTRYQGQAFCVAEGTLVQMADGSEKPIEDISVGEEVATLEGSNKVSWVSGPQIKKCVKVTAYDLFGNVVSQQLQPYTHPIALLSSEPLGLSHDWYQKLLQLQKSPLLWLSCKQLLSDPPKSLETSAYSKGAKNGCAVFGQSSLDALRPQMLFYPTVLHGQSLQKVRDRAAIGYCKFCKSSQQLLDSCQEPSKKQKNLLQPFAPFQLLRDCTHALSHPFCDGAQDALIETEKAGGSQGRCFFCSHRYDGQLRGVLEAVRETSHTQACVEGQDLDGLHDDEKGCTPLHNQYRAETYTHPYTLEQRRLEAPLELGIVRVEPLDDPYVVVRDITVSSSNNYITSGGIVNKNCWIGFDELTQWSSPYAWNYMRSRLRTTKNSGLKLYQRATTNPGGSGHQWVKKTFIDPAPPGQAFWATDPETGEVLRWPKGHSREGQPLFKRRFIPAKLSDNPYLADDGLYEANLLSLPEHQRKQLLEGNWDVAEGAAFPEFNRKIHVVEPFDIPGNWPRFRAADYGYSSYSGVLWFAVAPSEQLVVYRELYVSKVLAEDLADMVLDAEAGEKMRYGVLDSSLWHKRGDTGPSIAERMILKGCRWRPADRSKGSRVAGKNEIHRRFQIDEYTEEPRMIIFNTCKNLISQIPSLPLSKTNAEDVDTNSEDHLYDALRYGVMSRPRSGLFDFDNNMGSNSFKIADSTFGY
jgi:hypothetical protein